MTCIKLVIPILNNYQQAIEMLESVRTKHKWTPFIIPQWKYRWPLSRAWNAGLKMACIDGDPYVLIVNDDILFHPQTIDNLIEEFESGVQEEAIIITALNQRGSISPQEIFSLELPDNPTIAEAPDFSCFMVTRPDQFIQNIGLFDENFVPAYFEDNDMHYRIKLAGYKALTTTAAPYYHYGGGTQNNSSEGPVVSGDAFNRNAEYYARKWGGTPGAEVYQTPFNDSTKTLKDW